MNCEQTFKETRQEKKQFNKSLITMVLPISFQAFMMAAVSASDAVMLGFLSQNAMSAVSLAGQITYVFNILMTVLVQGTTLLAAQYWGKGERKSVEMILGFALACTLAVSIVFCALAIMCPETLMRIFTDDKMLIEQGEIYLRIVGYSYIPSGISQIYICIMKNSGKTLKSTVIGSSAMILNLGLNALLIFGVMGFPALGIRGAAVATTAAMLVQMGWSIAESLKPDSIQIRLNYILHIDKILRQDFIRYSAPIAGNYLFYGLGVTMYSVIIGHMGADAVAANSIASIVRNIISSASKGIGTAGAILVGNDLGRNQIEIAKIHAKRVTKFSALCGLISGCALLALQPVILNFVVLTPAASAALSGMLLICCYYMIPISINSTVIGGIFCAGGKSKFGCICDAIVLWCVIIPVSALAAFVMNVPVVVVYFILCLDEVIKIPVVFWYFRRYSWAQNITR